MIPPRRCWLQQRLGLLLFMTLQLAFMPTMSAAQNSSYEANPACPSMSLSTFVRHIQTEAGVEFDLPLTSSMADTLAAERGIPVQELVGRAEGMWDDATAFEFTRAKRVEAEEGGTRFPFIVCSEDADGGGDEWENFLGDKTVNRKSGYQRSEEIKSAITTAASNLGFNDNKIEDMVQIKAMYNERGSYCAVAILPGSVAEALEFENCLVQPMIMPTKVAGGTVRLAQKLLEKYYNFTGVEEETIDGGALDAYIEEVIEKTPNTEKFPSVTITLCQGVISPEMASTIGKDGSGDGTIEVSQLMTAWLLSKTANAEQSADNIAANLYWTSDDAAKYRGSDDVSPRGEFWQDVLDAVKGEDACALTYLTKLSWTLEPGYDVESDFSNLHVRYNNTGDADTTEHYCILAMIAGIAIMPEVCFFEINPEKSSSQQQTMVRTRVATNPQSITQSGSVGRVLSFNPDKSSQRVVTNPQSITQTGSVGRVPWFEAGLDGKGIVVAVSDTGIDINNCYFWDANVAEPGDDHRKIVSYDIGYADDTDNGLCFDAHGTHVAGIIAGRKSQDGIHEDNDGKADGIAPGARLAFLDTCAYRNGFADYAYPPDKELLSTGRREGSKANRARIHSASWGTPGWTSYTAQAGTFDNFMYNNDDLLVVVAAGNGGRQNKPNTIFSPSTAKNVLTVGASHSAGNDVAYKNLHGPSYVADFSGKGPTVDNRIAPDLVATGKFILAAGAQPSKTGECDPSDGSIPDVGYAKFKEGLKYDAGTSMATPVASGAAALILQYFEEGWYPAGTKQSGDSISPTSALVKAVLLNGAQGDLIRGVDNGSEGVTSAKQFDGNEGFGQINLLTSLYIRGKSFVQAEVWDRETVTDAERKSYTVKIDMSKGCSFPQLSATLTWMEEGSSSNCLVCLLNDLDLYVTKKGEESIKYYPNGAFEKDGVNTVERVVVNGVSDGDIFTLHVIGENLSKASQTFALVATGCFGGVASAYGSEPLSADDFSDGSDNQKGNSTAIIVSVVCAVAIVALGIGGFLIHRRRKQKS